LKVSVLDESSNHCQETQSLAVNIRSSIFLFAIFNICVNSLILLTGWHWIPLAGQAGGSFGPNFGPGLPNWDCTAGLN
jgi:hypothetical protein